MPLKNKNIVESFISNLVKSWINSVLTDSGKNLTRKRKCKEPSDCLGIEW